MSALVYALICAAIGAVAISGRRWTRAVSYVALLVLLAAMWATDVGAPRPSFLGLPPTAQVVAMVMDEGNAIFVWVKVDGQAAPVSIGLPWSESNASQLRHLVAEAQQRHGKAMMGQRRDEKMGSMYGGIHLWVDGPPPVPEKGQ